MRRGPATGVCPVSPLATPCLLRAAVVARELPSRGLLHALTSAMELRQCWRLRGGSWQARRDSGDRDVPASRLCLRVQDCAALFSAALLPEPGARDACK